MVVMKAARAGAVVWLLKMASLPITTISIRSHRLLVSVLLLLLVVLLLLLAQDMRSDNCISASAKPSSRGMPMIIFSPCVWAAWPMWRKAEQSIE